MKTFKQLSDIIYINQIYKNMQQYYRATVKMSYEDKKGNVKYKKQNYIVSAMSPTDVEAKLAKHLGAEDYEILGINTTNIADILS
jgi:Domain of unknown function (DUF4494)